MREGWKSARLGEISEMIKRGIAPKYIDSGGVCVINQKCVRDHSINYALARRHDIDSRKIPQERFIQLGDVLVNSTGTGTLGRVAQVRDEPAEPATVDTHVTIVRPADGVLYHDFFGYMLIKIEDEIINSGEGASGQTELARSKLENQFLVSFPKSIAEQKRIVAILDEAFEGIDTVVANTEKNLANARELFESFLTAAFASQSKNWREVSIGDIAQVKGGKRLPKGCKLQSDVTAYPYISVKDFNEHGGVNVEKIKYLDYNAFQQIKRYTISSDDLYVSIAGTIGKTGIVPRELDGANLTENACKLVFEEDVLNRYVYFFTRTESFREQALKNTRTTAQPKLALERLRTIRLGFPAMEEQQELVRQFDDIWAKAIELETIYQQKLTALAELKQSLLHKAFSGELTSTKAEAAVEEVTA